MVVENSIETNLRFSLPIYVAEMHTSENFTDPAFQIRFANLEV